MKDFLLKLLKFATLILSIATVVQLGISWYIKDKTINGHDNFLSVRNNNCDLIFLGSSRCTDHYIPRTFNESIGISTLNLGINGHGDLPAFIMRLNYYLKYNNTPKFVVLNFDPLCVNGPLNYEKNISLNGKHFFSRYAFFTQNDNEMIVKYFHYNFAEKYIPLYAILRYKILQECITLKGGKTWLQNGYLKNVGVWDSTAPIPIDNADGNYEGFTVFEKKYDSIKQQMDYFNKYCRDKKIKLICVQSPVLKLIYDKKSFELTHKMCTELGITFIDGNYPTIVNDIKNFLDPLHLNADGAKVFCDFLAKDEQFLSAINVGRKDTIK